MVRKPRTVWSRSASPQNDQTGRLLSLAASSGRPSSADRHDGGEPLGLRGGERPASAASHR